jgi:NADH-quinone oxidoreductase subunit L
MSSEQDMRVMGGLRRKLPVTYATVLVATLAIAGIFPLAGFFSKDEILWQVFSAPRGSPVLWGVGFFAAGLTAFYMMRLVSLTFYGENRASEEVRRHVHESPATMTVPLVILAALAVVGGWIGWPHFLGGMNRFEGWLAPVFHGAAAIQAAAPGAHPGIAAIGAATAGPAVGHAVGAELHAAAGEWGLAAASLAWGLVGLLLGYWIYARRLDLAGRFRKVGGGFVYRLLLNKYYVDEAYAATFVRPGYALSRRILWRWIDAGLIDGLLVNGAAFAVAITGSVLRLLQNGLVRFYAYTFALGLTAFVLYLTLSG